jgi:hypothetical protein
MLIKLNIRYYKLYIVIYVEYRVYQYGKGHYHAYTSEGDSLDQEWEGLGGASDLVKNTTIATQDVKCNTCWSA